MRDAMQIDLAAPTALDGLFRFGFSDEDPARAQRILTQLIAQRSPNLNVI
jgi:hypothetical protein